MCIGKDREGGGRGDLQSDTETLQHQQVMRLDVVVVPVLAPHIPGVLHRLVTQQLLRWCTSSTKDTTGKSHGTYGQIDEDEMLNTAVGAKLVVSGHVNAIFSHRLSIYSAYNIWNKRLQCDVGGIDVNKQPSSQVSIRHCQWCTNSALTVSAIRPLRAASAILK